MVAPIRLTVIRGDITELAVDAVRQHAPACLAEAQFVVIHDAGERALRAAIAGAAQGV